MNDFEKTLLELFGWKKFNKVQNTKIGIAGAGGVGSNCAASLVRLGFKCFTIIDFDIVNYSNLNRQFFFYNQIGMRKVTALKENLQLINPDIIITTLVQKLTKANILTCFSECDVIVEAFDNPKYKRDLAELILPTGKFVVSVSGIAGWKNIDKVRITKVKSNFYLVGDLTSAVSYEMPPLAPKVQVAALKQANLIFNYVIGELDKEEF